MAAIEETTTLALEEKSHLQKSLRRFDLLFFTVCAFVGLDTLGLVAANGPQGFTWLVVLAVLFVAPYALLMAEVGSAFTQEGGPYEWTKLAFGRLHAGIAAVLYWVTNPLWVGGSLAFIATEAWNDNIFSVGSAGSVGDYLFKLLFIWFSIGVAIASLRRGKWIPNAGAFMRLFVMGFFVLTVIVYAIDHGVHGFPVADLKPTGAIFLGLAPVLLFNYVGFELGNGAAEEMQDPQRDVPIAVLRSAVIGVRALRDPDLRDHPRAAARGGQRHRRLPGRGLDDVRRLRRGQGLPARLRDRRLRRHAAHLGRRVDDRLGPHPGGGGLRRGVPRLLRPLQRAPGHAGARQHAVGHHVDDLHGRRGRGVQQRRRLEVRHRPDDRDLDDADLLPVDLPRGAEAALLVRARATALPGAGRPGGHQVGGGARDVLGVRWAASWRSSPASWRSSSAWATASRTSGASAAARTRC